MKKRSTPKKTNYPLYGIHACMAAIKNPVRQNLRLHVTERAFKNLSPEDQSHARKRAEVVFCEGKDIEQKLNAGDVHQGMLLEVDPLPAVALEDVLEEENVGTIVLLDQVTDPHNVGAILRSCAAFGVSALVVPQHASAEVNGVLAKCASGALEHVPLVSVVNLKQAMETLKKAGYWCIGLDETGYQTTAEFDFDPKTAFVLGAEGKGLRTLTKETCDALVKLPTGGNFQTLNVSNAAAVALYEIFCQSTKRRKT